LKGLQANYIPAKPSARITFSAMARRRAGETEPRFDFNCIPFPAHFPVGLFQGAAGPRFKAGQPPLAALAGFLLDYLGQEAAEGDANQFLLSMRRAARAFLQQLLQFRLESDRHRLGEHGGNVAECYTKANDKSSMTNAQSSAALFQRSTAKRKLFLLGP